MKNKTSGHAAGYVAALGDLCRSGHGDIAENLLQESGFTFQHILKSGADKFDIDEVRKLYWKGK